MFWFFNKGKEDKKRIEMLENKVYVLEQTLEMVKMSLHSLQSALIAISNTQDSIGRDVGDISEVIENIVNVFEIEPQTHLSLVTTNPDDDLPN